MTTIAYRDGVIAADSLVSSGPNRAGHVVKIARGPDGTLAGAAGDMWACMTFLRAIETGSPLPAERGNDFDALVVDVRGKAHYVGDKGDPVPVDGDYFALGSGEAAALGAMEMGASAERAVAVAIKIDKGSGGPIRSLSRAGTP